PAQWLPLARASLPHHRHQLVVFPWTVPVRSRAPHLGDRRRAHRITRLSPLAAHVGEHRRDLLVVYRRSDRRHQADRAFLAAQEYPCRNVRTCERERRSDERGCDSVLPASIGLMAALADVAVDVPPLVESLLLLGSE